MTLAINGCGTTQRTEGTFGDPREAPGKLLDHVEALDEELEKALNEKKTRGRRR